MAAQHERCPALDHVLAGVAVAARGPGFLLVAALVVFARGQDTAALAQPWPAAFSVAQCGSASSHVITPQVRHVHDRARAPSGRVPYPTNTLPGPSRWPFGQCVGATSTNSCGVLPVGMVSATRFILA